jgi:threonine dehydrogenase-like Zn-dependent dehydrogenase
MKAAVFLENGRIVLQEKAVPKVGPRDALVRVTTTTICGTDVHILKGEYPVARGLTIGHEPVGVNHTPVHPGSDRRGLRSVRTPA